MTTAKLWDLITLIVLLEDLAKACCTPLSPFRSVFLPMGGKEWKKVVGGVRKFVNACLDMVAGCRDCSEIKWLGRTPRFCS